MLAEDVCLQLLLESCDSLSRFVGGWQVISPERSKRMKFLESNLCGSSGCPESDASSFTHHHIVLNLRNGGETFLCLFVFTKLSLEMFGRGDKQCSLTGKA